MVYGNILDVIVVEDALCQQDISWFVGEFLSDHRYDKAQFKLLKNGVSFKKEITRNLRDMDKAYFHQKLKEPNITDANCINEVVTKFQASLLHILDSTAPTETKFVRDRPPKPWMNDEVLLARRTYRRCATFWF